MDCIVRRSTVGPSALSDHGCGNRYARWTVRLNWNANVRRRDDDGDRYIANLRLPSRIRITLWAHVVIIRIIGILTDRTGDRRKKRARLYIGIGKFDQASVALPKGPSNDQYLPLIGGAKSKNIFRLFQPGAAKRNIPCPRSLCAQRKYLIFILDSGSDWKIVSQTRFSIII